MIEAYFIAGLGTDALAGVALVFPFFMLMQMMSAGAVGGGISSAVARALGANRRDDADTLVVQALAVAVLFGGAFTAALVLGGRWIYSLLDGSGHVLAAALEYSDVLFGGALLVWLFNSAANVLRGTGNMLVPAAATCIGAVLIVPLSPALIYGWGPFPALGVAGGAWAILCYYGLGAALLAFYIGAGRSVVRWPRQGARLRGPLLHEILRIGAVAALVSLMTNLTIAIATGYVGRFGAAAVAGYGVGARLEYLLVPLAFGLGAPLVALVGTNLAAGRPDRALRAAWIGASLAAAITGSIGLAAALFPRAWLGLFVDDPDVIAAGSVYLRTVGPVYGLFGLGMALYFASQGAGRMLWPLIANTARLAIAVAGGWIALNWRGELGDVFLAQSAGLAAFGTIVALAVARGAWRVRVPAAS